MFKERIVSFRNNSRLFRRYIRKYRKYYALGFFSLLIVDSLDLVHPLILATVIDNIVSGNSGGHLVWLNSLIDSIVGTNVLGEKLICFAALYLLIAVLKAVGRYLWRVYFAGSSFRSAADIRYKFFKHLTLLTGKFYSRARSGDLISLATNDVQSMRMMMGPGLLVLADAIFYLAMVPALLLYKSPGFALYAFITLPIVPFIMAKMSTLFHRKWKQVQDEFSNVTTLVHENISGIRINKSFNTEDFEVKRLRSGSGKYMDRLIEFSIVHSIFHPLIHFIFEIGVIVFIVLGGILTIRGSEGVTLGLFVACLSYIGKLTWPMVAIGWVISMYNRAVASNKRMEKVTTLEPEIKDVSPEESSAREEIYKYSGGGNTEPCEIEFRNLSFSYGNEPVLKGINLKIKAGSTLGIIGEVASGKSTLVNLIPRLYEVPDEKVFIDSRDIKKYPLRSLRNKISFVPQEVFLFSDSVKNNISFASRELSPSEMLKLSELVCMKKEIESFPNAFETMLGEKGVNLSGGQKQRLSLARALAHNSPVLILDDAFSSVDTEIEEQILSNLKNVFNEKTTIIVSHRISTLRYADRIIVIKDGKIVEDGTGKELMEEKGYFYTLSKIQKEGRV